MTWHKCQGRNSTLVVGFDQKIKSRLMFLLLVNLLFGKQALQHRGNRSAIKSWENQEFAWHVSFSLFKVSRQVRTVTCICTLKPSGFLLPADQGRQSTRGSDCGGWHKCLNSLCTCSAPHMFPFPLLQDCRSHCNTPVWWTRHKNPERQISTNPKENSAKKRSMSNQSQMWSQLKGKHKKQGIPRGKSHSSWLAASFGLQSPSGLGVLTIDSSGDTTVVYKRLCVAMQRMPLSGKSVIAEPWLPSATQGA